MKKILLTATLILTASTLGFSQNRSRYVFDNFSTPKGVEVISEERKNEPERQQVAKKEPTAKKSLKRQ